MDWSFRHLIYGGGWTSATEATARREPRLLYNRITRERGKTQSASAKTPTTQKSKFKTKVDWNFTLGTGRVAPNMSPAKFTFDISATPSCTTDYVAFALNLAGTSSQPNLVRFNNLYSASTGTNFCPGTGPGVMSAYNVTTSGNGALLTSPSISMDGTKVAFIETVTTPSAASIFHVLTWGTTGTNGSFDTGTNNYTTDVPNGVNNNAVMTSLSYSTSTNTLSSPWVDYHNDVAYFGDDNGMLYKTTCVFICATPRPPRSIGRSQWRLPA